MCPYCARNFPPGRTSYCGDSDCRRAWQREYNATRRPTETPRSYACVTCGATFERLPARGQRPRYCTVHAAGRGWKRDHPGSAVRSGALRRTRIRSAPVETFEPTEIYERDGWRCQIPGCGKLLGRGKVSPHPLAPTIDHIVPVSDPRWVDFGHTRANVRAAHHRCNVSRGARGGNDQLLLIG